MKRGPLPSRGAARSVRGHPRGDEGASAIEMSLIAPALLLLMFLGVQAGLWWFGRTVTIEAAREGASQLRRAEDRETYDALVGQVRDSTRRFAVNVGRESLLDPAVTSAYSEETGRVSVTVRGRVVSLVPGIDLGVRHTAYGEVERFEPDVDP